MKATTVFTKVALSCSRFDGALSFCANHPLRAICDYKTGELAVLDTPKKLLALQHETISDATIPTFSLSHILGLGYNTHS